MNCSTKLRKRLLRRALEYCQEHKINKRVFNSAVIFNDIKDNFHSESFQNILRIPRYSSRLNKTHSFFRNENVKELQSSASSDALLMNIFCHPKVTSHWKGIRKLLKVDKIESIEFGYYPDIERLESMRKTEVDMKIDNICFEAKLTEPNFTSKDILTVMDKYPQTREIFHLDNLMLSDDRVGNYQLIRNIIVANEKKNRFILLLHSERTDLIRDFYEVRDSIKSDKLKRMVSFITWQEIADAVGKDLRGFLQQKYDL